MNNDYIENINILMDEEKELIVLKGKMIQPQLCKTKNNNEDYYSFKLKTLKKNSNDEYGQSFNTYYCVVPVIVAKKYSKDDVSVLKNNEVLCICNMSAMTKKLQNGALVNNITVFVNYMKLVREIDNGNTLNQVSNL